MSKSGGSNTSKENGGSKDGVGGKATKERAKEADGKTKEKDEVKEADGKVEVKEVKEADGKVEVKEADGKVTEEKEADGKVEVKEADEKDKVEKAEVEADEKDNLKETAVEEKPKNEDKSEPTEVTAPEDGKKNEKDKENTVIVVDSAAETQQDSISGEALEKLLPDNQLGETQPSDSQSTAPEWKKTLMRPSTADLEKDPEEPKEEHKPEDSEEKEKPKEDKKPEDSGHGKVDSEEKDKPKDTGNENKKDEQPKESSTNGNEEKNQAGGNQNEKTEEDTAADEEKKQKAEAEKELKKKAAHARYMRFYRSITEGQKTPREILKLGEKAKTSGTRREMSYLYESWMSAGEDWKKSTVWINIQSKSGTIRKGVKCWMTRNQITQRLGKELMEDICSYKLSSDELKEKETRFHPDAPGVEAGRWWTKINFWGSVFTDQPWAKRFC